MLQEWPKKSKKKKKWGNKSTKKKTSLFGDYCGSQSRLCHWPQCSLTLGRSLASQFSVSSSTKWRLESRWFPRDLPSPEIPWFFFFRLKWWFLICLHWGHIRLMRKILFGPHENCFLFFFFFFFWMIFIFPFMAGLQCSVNFPPNSKVTQSHIHIVILFLTLSSIMLHREWLDLVPSAAQQDLIAYPLQRQ